MQQSTTSQFTLSRSGLSFVCQNSVNVQSGGSLSITYTITGAPTTLVVTIEGGKNATGDCALLDSYSGLTSTTRTISLNDTYDYFLVTASWTGSADVLVSASMSFSGSGPVQTAVTVLLPRSGVGSPQNVISAPVGTLFSQIDGLPGNVFWVKTSGTGSSGWTNVA